MLRYLEDRRRLLAIVLTLAVAAYIGWKISQSADQALQFAFNGLAVGAVYALLAMGFTLVYSTVWFFDLYYGAAAALGAYGVFYLRAHEGIGRYDVNNLYVNILFAALTAGVVAWALHAGLAARLRTRFHPTVLRIAGGLLAAGAGVYTGLILTYPKNINVMLSPAIGVLVALVVGWVLYRGYGHLATGAGSRAVARRWYGRSGRAGSILWP